MPISEAKKKIAIENYFSRLCNVETSIKKAFTVGFELGLDKGYAVGVTDCLVCGCKSCRFRKEAGGENEGEN